MDTITGLYIIFYKKGREIYIFYFYNWSADNWALPTVNSLSLYLGWYSDLFYNYIKQPGFSETLKRAKDLMAYRLMDSLL